MNLPLTFQRLAACLTLCAAFSIGAAQASAQDTGGKKQDDQKQGEKKQDDKKQDDKKQDDKKQEDKKQDEKKEINIPAVMAEAHQLRQNGELEPASKLYKQVTEADETNGLALHLYGFCIHGMGQLDEAIKIHTKAAEFEQFKGHSLYNLGCAYALKEEPEKALEYLKKAADAGFTSQVVMQDTDLNSLHENEEFKKIAARMKGDAGGGQDDGGQ